ncbi:MAG TPA: hypothetical protein VII99_08225 [Bacteroidia bacterium]
MRKYKQYTCALLFAICNLPFVICHSQSITNSPYSRFGLGDLQDGCFANNIPMGGIYNAMQNDTIAPFNINANNPASLASSRLTIFEFGLRSNNTQLETQSNKFFSNQTALAYMSLSFPVTKWWGASFGLMPYSSVGYKIYDLQNVDNVGDVKYSYEGKGGINQVYFGNGFRKKNFYIGAKVSYLFGDLFYFSRDSFPAGTSYMNTKYSQTTRFNNVYYTLGAQYKQQLGKNWSATIGATGGFQTNMVVRRTTFAATYVNSFGVETPKDTVIDAVDRKDTITIPLVYGFGFVLKKSDKLIIGLDYSAQNWSVFKSPGQTGIYKNSQKYAVGFQYIPNKSAGTKESYLKKIFYRAGVRYTNTSLEFNNIPLKDYALTLGAGFPLRKIKVGETYSQSIINLGIEIGQRGTLDQLLIRERYINVVLGFTLNDRWFIKKKYD